MLHRNPLAAKRFSPALVVAALALGLGCPDTTSAKTPPAGVNLVDNFDLERYLGLWFEVARSDNRFERGLSSVTAEYLLQEDGSIRVINRGYDAAKDRWEESRFRAHKINDPGIGQLKVTFFWPFSAGYNIFELDHEGYQYALVAGDHHGYLWILA